MIIYNVTVKVEPSIASEWLQWLKEEHIPAIMLTGCFSGFRILHLLDENEKDGSTFTIQYEAELLSSYEDYINNFSTQMRKEAVNKWGDRFIAFRTVMEVIG